MKEILDVAIPAVVFLSMIVVGLDLTAADFERVRRQPGLVAAGLVGPLLLLPPAALLLVRVLEPPPHLEAGLLLIATCPVGGISNTYNYLARASTALSVTLTGISCLLAVVTMPLVARVFELVLGRPFGFAIPVATLLGQLVLMLLTPIALGMALRRLAPAFAARHERVLRAAAMIGLALLVVFVIVQENERFRDGMGETVLLAAGLVVMALAAGALVGLIVRAAPADGFTLSVEFATRNVAVATVVAISLLGEVRFAVFATVYFLVELLIAGIVITAWRWWRASA
jgi:BASS family bile acid:Na+ symporter